MKKARRLAAEWNEQHDIGTPVCINGKYVDLPEGTTETTRSKAFADLSGCAVIFISNWSGWIRLDAITPMENHHER